MTKFTMTHEFNCSVETYWKKLQFDDEVNNTLYKKTLGFPEYTVLEQRDGESEIVKRVKVTPKIDMPAVSDGTRSAVTRAKSIVVAPIRPTTPAATPSRKACSRLFSTTASSRS